MKRVIFSLMALALMVSICCGASLAQEEGSVRIRVGFPTDAADYSVLPSVGHEAVLMDSLQELSKYANWRYEIIRGTQASLLDMLEAGEIDMIGGMFHTEALEQAVLYPRYVSGYAYALLVANPGDDRVQRNDFSSLQNSKIAAVAGSNEANRLLGYLALNSITASVLYTDTQADALNMLQRGEVDMALVGDDNSAGYRTISAFVVGPVYLVVSPRHPELAAALDRAYEALLSTNPGYLDSLYEAHLGQAARGVLELTDAEKSAIESMPQLRVAMAGNNAPMVVFDDNGDPQGILPDLFSLIAAHTGLRYETVPVQNIPQALSMVDEGLVDAILGIYTSDGNLAGHDMITVNPMLEISRVVLYNSQKQYPGENMTLALKPGMDFLRDPFTQQIIYADTFEECVLLVSGGEADYTYGSTYEFGYGTQRRSFHNVQMTGLPGNGDSLTLGLARPVDPALLSAINKAIGGIDPGDLQDIVLRNTTLKPQSQSLRSIVYSYPMVVVAVLCCFIALIVVVAVVIALQRARHSRALYRTQYIDELTGAMNLTGFRRMAPRLLQEPVSFAMIYASVRSFQYINEQYGFAEGDDILRRIATTIGEETRENELYCRISGGSFASLVRYTCLEELLARLDAFQERLHHITPRNDPSYHIRMIAGVYPSEPGDTRDVLGMIDRANVARQQIGDSSVVNYVVYRKGFFDDIAHVQTLEAKMESALAEGEFLVYLQPKYDLATMKPGGAEALVRWLDNGKIVPPGEFIPHFERNGFIARLDRYVFTQCCIMIRRWIDEGRHVIPISINVSRVQLYAQDFPGLYIDIKRQYDIPAGLIDLEFTESILFDDVDKLIRIVNTLHENGFECSIDDFGKGYSSLTMLKNIPADTIKLDAQFFDSGISGQRDTIIVESIVEIAHALGMVSLAEGIETEKQVKLLQMIGCDMAQGYVFSKPLPAPVFERYLADKMRGEADPFAPFEAR